MIGVMIGLIVTPLVALGLTYGTDRIRLSTRVVVATLGRSNGSSDKWVGALLLLAVAVVLGLLVASRVSPLASLVPGVAFTGLGLLWLLDPGWAVRHPSGDTLPNELVIPYMTLGMYGLYLVIGVLLVAASVVPSRWQARAVGAAPRYGGPPPAPMGPPPLHGAPAPLGAPRPPQAPQAPPPAGQGAPHWQGPPQFGQGPGASNPPPLPPASSPSPAASPPPAAEPPKRSTDSGPDDDEPGEWTRVYGGNS
ncbi:hypothetical protein [Actinomadura pelletieri]|nr:hypothetical protein [Actinomadura pelletieri]